MKVDSRDFDVISGHSWDKSLRITIITCDCGTKIYFYNSDIFLTEEEFVNHVEYIIERDTEHSYNIVGSKAYGPPYRKRAEELRRMLTDLETLDERMVAF